MVITLKRQFISLKKYLREEAWFRHRNPALLKNSNRDNIIIISGIVFAKNLVVEIETDFRVTAELIAALTELADGKLDLSGKGDTSF